MPVYLVIVTLSFVHSVNTDFNKTLTLYTNNRKSSHILKRLTKRMQLFIFLFKYVDLVLTSKYT